MLPEKQADRTALTEAVDDADASGLGQLVEAVYPELRAIARRYLRQERAGHTLQCTALVNEAYLRLAKTPNPSCHERKELCALAAHIMRGILVDYARARQCSKRGSGAMAITISDYHGAISGPPIDLLDLHQALDELDKLDATQSQIVEMRYFGGFSIEDTAENLGLSASTVKREWLFAKTWIHRRLLGQEPGG